MSMSFPPVMRKVTKLLSAIGELSSNGLVARTAAGTAAARTLTGTAAEITVANGDGASGNPTLSLPTALTFTGKTVTGGTFSSVTLSGTTTLPGSGAINSSGYLGIGTASPAAGLDVRGGLTGNGQFLVAPSTTAGSGAGGAYLQFMGSNSTAVQLAGIDGSMTDGTAGAESGILAFYTRNAGTLGERARIDSSGIGVGVSPTFPGHFYGATGIKSQKTNTAGISVFQGAATSTSENMVVWRDGDGNDCGLVSINASANTTAYGTSSDHRLKDIIGPADTQAVWDALAALPVYRGSYKADPGSAEYLFFLAHEVSEHAPWLHAVIGEKDAADLDGHPVYQNLDYGRLTPLLAAALKHAQTEIAALTARVTALEAV